MSDVVAQVKRRWLPVYITLLGGGLLILTAMLYLYFKTGSETYLSGAALLVLVDGYVGWSLFKLLSVRPERRYLVTHATCSSCGYTVEREYRSGDTLFSKEGKCPKCGGDLDIDAIFLRVVRSRS